MRSDIEIEPAPAQPDLLASATALAEALVAHAHAVLAADGDPDALIAADHVLTDALRSTDAAYTALTGEAHPMRIDEFYEDETAEGCGDCGCGCGSAESSEASAPASLISVFQRHDYALGSPADVLAAGRDAYLRNNPDAEAADAEREVSEPAEALVQLAHADGWNNLWRAEAFAPLGGVAAVFPQAAPLQGEPEDWADEVLGDLVANGVEPLFVQVDVYGD